MNMRSIGPLETPQDLLGKLTHDFERVQADLADTHAAFDFFVTAHHMADWVHPGDQNTAAMTTLRKSSPLLQAVSNIANSWKHFIVDPKRHRSVRQVDAPDGGFDSGGFDPHGFDTDALSVTFDGDAASEFGDQMLVVDLAEKVLRFWDDYVHSNC
jgi:hypothetical protein